LTTLLAALPRLLLLLTRLVLAAAALLASWAALTAALVLLATLILLTRLLFVGVHICSFNSLRDGTTKGVDAKFLSAAAPGLVPDRPLRNLISCGDVCVQSR
jgi:hypothetical protein